MVRVVTAVGGQVEGDRQTLLAGGQVAPVERVGFGGGGEPGVLADGPGLVDVHGRVRPAHERRGAGEAVERVAGLGHLVTVGGDVHGLDVDALGRRPGQLLGGVAVRGGGRRDMLFDGLRGRRASRALPAQRDVGEATDL